MELVRRGQTKNERNFGFFIVGIDKKEARIGVTNDLNTQEDTAKNKEINYQIHETYIMMKRLTRQFE